MKNGGYAIISHDDINIFNKIDSAYKAGKPILFYDDDKTCFYVDSVKLNGDGDYEFTKGGKTWTVTDNNTLSSEGQIQNHLYRYDLFLEFDDDQSDGYKLSLSLLLNELIDITDTNIKEVLYNYEGKYFVGYAEEVGGSSYFGFIGIKGNTVDGLYFDFNNGGQSTESFDVSGLTLTKSVTQLF